MDRRNLLKTVGGIGVTASAAGAGVLATSGSAAAAEIGTFDISNPNVVTTDDGTIHTFTVDSEVSIQYDGMDTEVRRVLVEFGYIKPGANGTGQSARQRLAIQSAKSEEEDDLGEHAGSHTFNFESIDVLSKDPLGPAHFTATEDGKNGGTSIEFFARFWAEGFDDENPEMPNSGGDNAVMDSGSVTVTVHNEEATASIGVSGSSTIDGEDQDPNSSQTESE